MRPLFYLIVLCTSLYGCGQTGALYIPQPEPQEQPAASKPPKAPGK
jgi:predicted small lipoprotein YifL